MPRADQLMELARHRPGKRLAAAVDVAQRREWIAHPGGADVGEERAQHRRHEVQPRHPVAVNRLDERGRILLRPGRGQGETRAGDRPHEQLDHRHVEGDGGRLQLDVVRRERMFLLHPEQAVDDRAVLDERALGPAGRARGVDHVGEIARPGGIVQTVRKRARLDVIRKLYLNRGYTRRRPGPGAGEDRDRPAILKQKRDPLVRLVRIDRHVGAARAERAEERDGKPFGAAHEDGDGPARAGAGLAQPMGEDARSRLEFREGEPGPAELDRDPIGIRGGLPREEIVQPERGIVGARGVVEVDEHLALLAGREDGKIVDRRRRRERCLLEHVDQSREHPPRGVAGEEVAVVFKKQ